jgi:UDP-GlcNAc:undecaprenyl-phosphate GlcNAc-1-phosphate transferase
MHLHHRLLALGFGHRATVLLIYAISIVFSVSAIIFSKSVLWGSLLIGFFIMLMAQLSAELTGKFSARRRPLVDTLKRLVLFGGNE